VVRNGNRGSGNRVLITVPLPSVKIAKGMCPLCGCSICKTHFTNISFACIIYKEQYLCGYSISKTCFPNNSYVKAVCEAHFPIRKYVKRKFSTHIFIKICVKTSFTTHFSVRNCVRIESARHTFLLGAV
jgi:hypothetical protein